MLTVKFIGLDYPPIQLTNCNNLNTIVKGLICNFGDAFKQQIKGLKLVCYTTDNNNIPQQDVGLLALEGQTTTPIKGQIMYITTDISGSGGNFFNVLLGAVLIGAGLLFGSPLLLGIGATFLVRGLSGMLAPTTSTPSKVEQQDSYLFSNTQATNRSNDPVAMLYGQYLCSNIALLSSSISKTIGL